MKITTKPNTTIKNKTGGWRTYIPKRDLNKCTGCGTCAKVCPENAIQMVKINNKLKSKVDYNFCKGCALCAAECPVRAITMLLDKK
ncbi:MAG: 4Fe-4S binding protein [Patescibacteria group bacterium]